MTNQKDRDPVLTDHVRAAGINGEDEEYAWDALRTAHDSYQTHTGRLRIRAVAGFPHNGQLDRPTFDEMIEAGLSQLEAAEYVAEWSREEAERDLDNGLFVSAACIAGARALDALGETLSRVRLAMTSLDLLADGFADDDYEPTRILSALCTFLIEHGAVDPHEVNDD